ncbi:MAG TPA: SO_0444 family Cu/Zn efflux transporter [Vicinamibacteria bacterium]|nr:SO_0444 family Cu/Zn efflux transporter [Vicinamibacteria bacterium]
MNPWETLTGIAVEAFRSTIEAGPFVLLGLFVAGLLHEFLDTSRIVAALGGRNLRSILAATFLGAPLPLCSCGVLPAALSLRKKGASREATIAFLISTPETGVDSIALTYGLLGPFMAVARPLAAIVTGVVAGVFSLFQPELGGQAREGTEGPSYSRSHETHVGEGEERPRVPLRRRLGNAARYGFTTLLDDLTFWLVLAFLVAGVLAACLPPDFFQRYLPGGFLSLIVMAALGIPTYVCASASTPVAAAMVAKGLNPGAALVFMLTGPATNASTFGIVARLFGRRFVVTYIGAIFAVALAAGVLVNLVLGPGWTPPPASDAASGSYDWPRTAAGLALLLLMGRSLARTGLRPGLAELTGHFRALAEWGRRVDWRVLPRKTGFRVALAGLLVVYLGGGLVAVGPGEEGLGRAFGRVSAARLQPGLHLFWPPPIGRVDIVATSAIRTVEIGYMGQPDRGQAPHAPRSFPRLLPSFGGPQTTRIPEGSAFLAGDETVVTVTGVVQYQVSDAARYQLGIDHPESVVRAVARAALVEMIARVPIDAIYSSSRGEVEACVLKHLRASPTVAAIGVKPISLDLLYVHAPDEVHAAFRDVASAAEDTTTIRNKALVEAEGSVRLARGEAARLVFEAGSYRVQQVEHARGNAAAFVPLAAEDRRASTVTRERLYLEAMERVLARVPKLIKPSPRKAPGLELWVTPAEGTSRPSRGESPPGSGFSSLDDEEESPQPRPTPPPRP